MPTAAEHPSEAEPTAASAVIPTRDGDADEVVTAPAPDDAPLEADEYIPPPPREQKVGGWRDFVALAKPGITIMCVLMTAGGAGLAIHGDAVRSGVFGWVEFAWLLLGTALSVSSANALNMLLEREGDRDMVRTRNRPLPSGRMHPMTAIGYAILTGLTSVWVLYTQVNPLTAWLSVFALVSYVAVYTPLKRRTTQALIIGAVPGAIPPLLGWTGATNEIGAPGIVLFLILLLWQLPHFIAIAIYRGRDYAAAGIKAVSVVRGVEVAKVQSLIYCVFLVPVSLLLVTLNIAGYFYFVVASALGAWFFVLSVRGFEPKAGTLWARRFFLASLVYLPVLTAGLVLDIWWRGRGG